MGVNAEGGPSTCSDHFLKIGGGAHIRGVLFRSEVGCWGCMDMFRMSGQVPGVNAGGGPSTNSGHFPKSLLLSALECKFGNLGIFPKVAEKWSYYKNLY